ncbi:ABC transporter ATP-binding protein [Fodinicurvata sediminis]|uniref:ABC transporter ATP-binding protein n=1 Tax=Fodinicurvata sediminis TaxID=1121832 RepID=UPI0003B6F0A7|nr:ABC transporter ATP-binding protein [Fodinicurvata sediminis]
MSASAISLKGISLSYKGQPLFQEFNLELPAGLTSCLLGPSGVGKSSLLRVIAGLERGASGCVSSEDQTFLVGQLAYMAQQDLLLPWLKLVDNVVLPDRLAGRPVDMERARHLLQLVGLNGHEAKLPATLSGGMRQRAALARTLYQDRQIILMDEPFSAVDSITRLELQELTAELLRDRTVLLVTHDPLEALRLGHRLIVLAGQPVHIAEQIELTQRPPRDIDSPEITSLQTQLINSLRGARQHLAAESN